jgi:CBS domain-containing protein
MKVRDIGMKEVHCADSAMDLNEVAAMMKRHNIGVVPVCEGGKLLGMLTDRDLVVSCMASDMDPKECTAREYMTAKPVSVTPDTDLEEAAKIMGKEQLRRLAVVENGNLVGMVSLGDIAMNLDDDFLVAEMLRKVSSATHMMMASSTSS